MPILALLAAVLAEKGTGTSLRLVLNVTEVLPKVARPVSVGCHPINPSTNAKQLSAYGWGALMLHRFAVSDRGNAMLQ